MAVKHISHDFLVTYAGSTPAWVGRSVAFVSLFVGLSAL